MNLFKKIKSLFSGNKQESKPEKVVAEDRGYDKAVEYKRSRSSMIPVIPKRERRGVAVMPTGFRMNRNRIKWMY